MAMHDTQKPLLPFVPAFAGLVWNGFATVPETWIDLYGFQIMCKLSHGFVMPAKIYERAFYNGDA